MEIIDDQIKIYNSHTIFVKRSINNLNYNMNNIDNMFFSEGIKKKRLSIDKCVYIFSTKKIPTEEEIVAEYNKKQNLLLSKLMFG